MGGGDAIASDMLEAIGDSDRLAAVRSTLLLDGESEEALVAKRAASTTARAPTTINTIASTMIELQYDIMARHDGRPCQMRASPSIKSMKRA